MGQLIKMFDYISRYEVNPFHYPTQFIQLKRENWRKLNEVWENQVELIEHHVDHTEKEKSNIRSWFNFFSKSEKDIENRDVSSEFDKSLPRTETELRQYFLDEIFNFQIKWATSTISQVSFTEQSIYKDQSLKFFLQRLPDIYLVMYYPIFNVQNVPMDGEIILISPIGINIIALVEEDEDASIIINDERTWEIEKDDKSSKLISPLIRLKRCEQIINSILNKYNIDFPVNKTVLSKQNYFIHSASPYNTTVIGKREFKQWHEQLRNFSSSLKNIQIRAIEALLKHCQTTSVRRPEWDHDPHSTTF